MKVYSLSSIDSVVPRIKFQKVAQKVSLILLITTWNQSAAIVNWQNAFSFALI